MPSRKVHDTSCLMLGVASVPVGLHLGVPLPYCFLLGAGAISGIFLSPDLDIADKFRFGFARIYWYPYSKAIPHRHWISHFPIIGTAIRITYILPLLVLIYLLIPVSWDKVYYPLIGLMISDGLHWLLDITTTRIKRII